MYLACVAVVCNLNWSIAIIFCKAILFGEIVLWFQEKVLNWNFARALIGT